MSRLGEGAPIANDNEEPTPKKGKGKKKMDGKIMLFQGVPSMQGEVRPSITLIQQSFPIMPNHKEENIRCI
jgi:hypothetical protein